MAITSNLLYAFDGITNNWPSYEHPRKKRQQLDDLADAVESRANAIYFVKLDPLTDPLSYSNSYRGYVPNIFFTTARRKVDFELLLDKTADMLPYYLDQTKRGTNTWDGFLAENYYLGGTGSRLPTYTNLIELLTYLKMPTNYFVTGSSPLGNTNSLYRGWSGIGGHTNDTSVGHPYGYTNSFTADGGTNFPNTNRTCWYTTDYGFEGLSKVLGMMTQIEMPYNSMTWSSDNTNHWVMWNSYGTSSVFSTAITRASDNWSKINFPDGANTTNHYITENPYTYTYSAPSPLAPHHFQYAEYDAFYEDYVVQNISFGNRLLISTETNNLTTNFNYSYSVRIYAKHEDFKCYIWPNYEWDDIPVDIESIREFDANGGLITRTNYYEFTGAVNADYTNKTIYTTTIGGYTNIPAQVQSPHWGTFGYTSEPPSFVGVTMKGWQMVGYSNGILDDVSWVKPIFTLQTQYTNIESYTGE